MAGEFKHFNQVYSLDRAPGLRLVMDSPKGRGVFASQSIPRGTIVEVSPVLVFTETEVKDHTAHTCLEHYTYYWPNQSGHSNTQAIALGLGSMFNHSTRDQNVVWSRDIEGQCIIYTAHRDIQAGEELCISYGSKLWFEDADAASDDDEYSRIEAAHNRADQDVALELDISGLGGIEI